MMMIYEAAQGSRLNWVSGQWLLDASGLRDEDLGDICQYLESERMIEGVNELQGSQYWSLVQFTGLLRSYEVGAGRRGCCTSLLYNGSGG
jgi:hypothetical protein